MSERKCRINRVDQSDDHLQPFIAEFQNGSLRQEAASNLSCHIFEHNKNQSHCMSVISNSMCYMGHEEPEEMCQTFLAIRNLESNEVRLVPTKKCLLTPVIAGKKVQKTKTEVEPSYAEKFMKLAKSFGSKRDIRRIERKDKLETNIDVIKEELNASVSKVVFNEEDLVNPQDTFLTSLPRCNRQATNARDVYQLEDVVSAMVIQELEEEAKRILDNGLHELANSSYQYSQLFELILVAIIEQKSSEKKKIRQLAALLYMEYIVSMLAPHMAMNFRNKEFLVCEHSKVVSKKLMKTFTAKSPHGRLMPLELRDKATCHVIIIALLLHDLKVPFKQLMSTVKGSSAQLSMLCGAIGATCVAQEDGKYAILQIPLPSAEAYKARGIKRRHSRK